MRTFRLRRRLLATALVSALAGTGAVVCAPASPAVAAPATWIVAGPAATPTWARVAIDASGVVTLGVVNRGATVLAPTVVGVETTAGNLTGGLTFLSRQDRTVTEQYAMKTGKRLSRQATMNESTFAFSGAGGRRMDLVVRVSDQGVGYRYVLPGSGSVTVTREASAFSVPAGSPAWVLPYSPNYENEWVQTTAGGAGGGDFGFPGLFEVNGTFVLVTESDMSGRYSGGRLTHSAGSGTYRVKLDDAQVTSALPLATPWRVAVVGTAATVAQSTLVDDLAPPSRVADTSWIRPGAVGWSWIPDSTSPKNPQRQREYVDFAARNGWRYVLVDEGWNASWIPELVQYAKARNVEILIWYHWSAFDTQQERDTVLPLVKSWGVAGLKIDFMDSDSQRLFRWYDEILPATAAHKLMLNFHGATVPRGMQRTWPHLMTSEGIRGAENWRIRAARNTMFPFTRNAVGSMDFTPVAFLVGDRDTTDGHEVATWFAFESGWQHGADKPEAFEARPEGVLTIDQIPQAWDETRLLAGRPGREAYFAKRSGDRWFVGGLSAVAAKTFSTPLTFLGSGQYLLETMRDGPDGLLRETRVAQSTDSLSVPVATNGGFVTVACPYTAGMVSCDRPVRPNPSGNRFVSDLPFIGAPNGWGPVERDRSNGENLAGDGKQLSIRGTTFGKGIGVHAPSVISVWLGTACQTFTAKVGIDDEVAESGSVEFQVRGDGRQLATSGVVRKTDAAKTLTADVTGVRVLTLRVTEGGDNVNFDHADWADARLTCS